ncbi:transglycosylase domain-containing protein [Parapedobacter lycopersici]|uniref:transglycosylase domain-containing protein n=1 Tax=Parapedobacter lycopersici TaxID=1864939 RepID=UPI0033412A94
MNNWFSRFLTKITKKQLIIAGIVAGVLLVAGAIALAVIYHKRENLLTTALARIQSTMAERYQVDLAIDTAYFSGLSTVTFQGVTLTPQGREQLMKVRDMSVRVRLFPLLVGNIKFGQLRIYDTDLTLVKKDSVSNYDFIFRKADSTVVEPEVKARPEVSLAQAANRMLNDVLYKIPKDMELRNFSFSYRDDSTHQYIRIPKADVDRGSLTSAVFLNDNSAAWQVSGTLNPDRRQLSIKVHANGKRIAIPLLERKFGLELSFDTLETRLRDVFWTNNELLHFTGEWAVKNLTINHRRIAEEDIVFPDAHMDAELIVGNSHVELAKKTAVTVKKLTVHPYIRYTTAPNETYALGIETPEMEAQDLFDAFPKGLFTALEGIRVSGKIQYHLDAFLDTDNPDSVRFNSSMMQDNFKVNAWGNANIPKINTTFVYTPYENEKPVRDIVVGPENPDFTPIGQISPYLKNAILTTEDPSFYSHNGFVEEAIRTSIATNYKARSFKRGGSTISMQLVKNVYLNRNKTMVRKLEEILIVWLMESTRAVSKDRMYEVYLNIIEWGRNVYGIGEAARYYFSKQPSQLTLGESIYLASIVPRPKTGLYAFTYYGGLKPYISSYFRYIGNIMARRGLAPADSTGSYGFYAVNVREALRPDKPASADTLQLQMPQRNFDGELEEIRGLLDRIFGPGDPEEELQ